MKRIMGVMMIACLFSLSVSLFSQAAAGHEAVSSVEAQKWSSDIDHIVKRIEIMHPNPYAFVSKEEFHKEKGKLLDEIPKMSEVDIVISISELLAKYKDGHTRWALERSDPQWLEKSLRILPVLLYPFRDGVFVIAGLPPYAGFVGMEVKRVGGVPVAELISRIGPMWSSDNPYGEKKYLYYSLCIAEFLKKAGAGGTFGEIEIVLLNKKSREIKTAVKPVSFMSMAGFLAGTWYPHSTGGLIAMNDKAENPLPLWLKNRDKLFWHEYLSREKIMFLQINSLSFRHDSLHEPGQFGALCRDFFKEFDASGAAKLVIDIRRNTGGNHVEQPLLREILARPQLDRPDKLFLITGRVTFSAAVHLTTALRKNTNVTIVGEAAGGRPNHFGASRYFKLPNHPQIVISCSVDYYQDSEPFDFNIMNAPRIWAEMSSGDYATNSDPAIKAIINYDQIESLAGTTLAKLEKAYSGKGIQGIRDEYKMLKPALLRSGYSIEELLSELYERHISKSEKDVLDYLSFAVAECPASIDLRYARAFQLDSDGRLPEAKEAYRECLKINPAHHYARMRLGLIDLQ